MNSKDKNLIDEWIFSSSDIKNMRKRNPKWCIYHWTNNILDCYHCWLILFNKWKLLHDDINIANKIKNSFNLTEIK